METIQTRCSEPKWHWDNIVADLKRAGLRKVSIDPLSVRPHSCGGAHEGNRFYLSWVQNHFAMLTMQRWDGDLVSALTAVLDYGPFCRYTDAKGLPVVEWDRDDPAGRAEQLRAKGLRPVAVET